MSIDAVLNNIHAVLTTIRNRHQHSPPFCNEEADWGYNEESGEAFDVRPWAKRKVLERYSVYIQ